MILRLNAVVMIVLLGSGLADLVVVLEAAMKNVHGQQKLLVGGNSF